MPFKDFTVGQVLTSAEVDTFLMRQSVMVFDDASDRQTALGSFVTEGMLSYLKDIDRVQAFDGSSWNPVGVDAFTTQGTPGYLLVSQGTAGVDWVDNGTPGQNLVSDGTAGIRAENSISPLLLLGV
jgi:formate dehydrogenase assembly factor FdhD